MVCMYVFMYCHSLILNYSKNTEMILGSHLHSSGVAEVSIKDNQVITNFN
jgi:hypothetical protein